MTTKKWLTKVTLGLSLCAFCYPVFLSLYIIQNCPAILKASGDSKGWYLVGGLGNGILLFSIVWIIYGIVRWVLIWPVCFMVKYLCNLQNGSQVNKARNKQINYYEAKSRKLRINCPQCGRSLTGATQDMIGDTGVCPKCKAEFTIQKEEKQDR